MVNLRLNYLIDTWFTQIYNIIKRLFALFGITKEKLPMNVAQTNEDFNVA